MKKLIIILICCLAVAARAENLVSVSSANGHPQDEVTLNVSLTNSDAVVAFQVEIPLGSQLTYVAGSAALNAARITDHQVSAAVVNGTLKIFAYSLSLTPFVGNDGDLFSFTLRLKNEPGDYILDMGSAKLSDATGTALSMTPQNGSVTILSPKLSINTTSLNYGHVPIRSEYSQTASVTNVGNEPLTITDITFSDAVFCCPDFAETTLQAGGSTSFTFKFAPMAKGAVSATATIISNSVSGNGTIQLLADPFAVNEIHIGNIMGYCDSIVELPISMNNMEDIIGFQIEANISDALEFVDFTLSDRKTDHVATGIVSGTTLRLMAYSTSGSAFTGEDGVLGTARFRLHGLYGDYYVNPFKAVLSNANGDDVLSAKYQGYVNIRSPKIVGNNSLSFGSTPVTETVTKEYVVNNTGNAPMRIDQVVFDQEGYDVAETFPITIQQGASATLHVSYSRNQRGNFSATMKIYSNDPENGLKNVALSGSRYEPNSIALSVDPFNLGNGDVAVTISMNNYSGIVAMQADFCYPHHDYSVTTTDFALTERFAGHSLYALPLNDSTYRILVLSMQNDVVVGYDGAVLNVILHPVATPSQEEYTIEVSQVVLSGAEGSNVYSEQGVSVGFSIAMATQAMELATGWNWWAPTVFASLQQLEGVLADKGVSVNSQSSGSVQYTGGNWSGNLQRIVPGQMYRIQTNDTCNIELPGMSAVSATIEINPGLTWFGYIGNERPIAQALSEFQPVMGDMINSQREGFSIYGANGWSGSLERLQTGHGYVYLSKSTSTKVLSFSVSHPSVYTAVDYIWAEKQNGTTVNQSTIIDTDIKLANVSKVRCKMKPMAKSGNVWIGNLGNNDNQDFRLFATSLSSSNAYMYFDYKSARANSSSSVFVEGAEVDITIEITSDFAYVYLTDTGSTSDYLYRNNNSGSLQDLNFLAVINCIKLGELQVWDANGVLVKDMKAALDFNDIPCMYDEVNHEFVYKSGVDRTMYYE